MRYLPLFEIRLSHSYYASGRCSDLFIEPTDEALAVVRGHRLVLKPYTGGLRVLAPVDLDESMWIPFASGTSMRLRLGLGSPKLSLFTDMSAHTGMVAPLYRNSALTPGTGGTLTLVDEPDGLLGSRTFAEVELLGLDAMVPSSSGRVFEVALAPKAKRWAYYVVTDTVSESVALVDTDPAEDYTPIDFDTNNNPRDLAALPDPNDPVASMLAERYPTFRRMRFVTSESIPLHQAPRSGLELHLAGLRQASALPNPSVMDHTTVEMMLDGATHLEPSLFRLIKHITQTSSSF